jgi:prepilin-type N-terminal cleavage/methylation domain-containing protein
MRRIHDPRGFTLLELMLVVAVITVIGAMAVPQILSTTDHIRISSASRQVERELQTARMKAVRANRPVLVRFNCPAAGRFRAVELLGSVDVLATDDYDSRAAARCSEVTYPYPDPDPAFFALPNNDGPVRYLPAKVTFGAVQPVMFRSDGSAYAESGGAWAAIPLAGITLTMYDVDHQSTMTKSITVNGLGKITLQ